MKFASRLKRSVLAMSISLAYSGALASELETPDSESSDIEKILVLGEKAGRSVKDTTSSLSILDEDVLNSTEFKSVSDAVSEVANVIVLSGALPDIRGVSGNGSAGGFNSITGGAKGRISVLVDGVAQPFVADIGGDTGLWDLQQMEIYRGPQSTNNGRNSIGGAIYMKTKDPSQEWEGAARIGYRNQDQYIDTAGVISGPLVEDTLAFRFSAQQLIADTITGDSGYDTNPPEYDLDEIKTRRVHAKLLWTPSDDLSVILSHADTNERGDTGRIYYALENLEDRERIFYRDIETDVATTSLTAEYQLNDLWSLDVLLAHMDYTWGFDSYETAADADQQLVFDESNITLDAKVNYRSANRDLSGFIGLYYFERDQDFLSQGSFVYGGDDQSDSMAIYGEVSADLNDKFTLIAGARVEKESQDRNIVYGAIDSVLLQDTNIFLPTLALQYAWSPATNLAISARKGYNAAGGALNFAAGEYYYFDEEKVNAFELSSRTQFAEGKGYVNANIFYNDYDGFQALNSSRTIVNIPNVVTYGFEFELQRSLSDQLELFLGAGWLHSEIKGAGDEYAAAEGNKLNSAPSFNANLGLTYYIDDSFSIGTSARHVGEYFGDFTNTEARIAGDYTVVRFNAKYVLENWLFTAYVDNAFDEDAILTQEPASRRYPQGFAAIVDPRNLGFSATYRF